MTTQKGRDAEDVAVLVLVRLGYDVVGRNVRVGRDEVDVIAKDGAVVGFIEGRKRARFADALTSIDARKQARISRAAENWLAKTAAHGDAGDLPTLRFDVVIVADDRQDVVKNAFEAEQ